MKNHRLLLLGLLFALVLAGLLTRQGGLLALAIPLGVYLGVALAYSPEAVTLSAARTLSADWVGEQDPATALLRLTNTGQRLEDMRVCVPLPAGVQPLTGQQAGFAALAAGETLELRQTFRAGRGEYRAPEILVTAGETFGLFAQTLCLPAPFCWVVRPRAGRLRSLKIRPPQTRGFAGPIAARQGGVGVDFFALREYQPGDPRRQINWRVAARHTDTLFTNVFEQERVADVGLILDARQSVEVVAGGQSLFEEAVRATAALADSLLHDGQRVGLWVYGGLIQRVFPGSGRVQRQRLLRVLSAARPGHNYALESLGCLPTRSFPARSQIVLVSPLQPGDVSVLVQLRSQGYAVLVVCPDPVDFEVHRTAAGPGDDWACRLARAERNFLLQQVRRVGVQVIEWRVTEPLETCVRRVLENRPGVHPRLGAGR